MQLARVRRSWVPALLALLVTLVGAQQLAHPRPASAATTLGVHVSGNRLVDSAGAPVALNGVNLSGSEYACIQGWGFFDMPTDAAAVTALRSWHVKSVRVPLNEDCWLGINGAPAAYSGSNYRSAIAGFVSRLNSQGIYAVLELHWSAPGTAKATGQRPMPDAAHSPAFWSGVATSFKDQPGVLFDLFNEPYPDGNQDTTAAWTCWRDGGTCSGFKWQAAGMKTLLGAVRGTGAQNVVLLGGVQYSNALSRWLQYAPVDPAGQLVAAAHVYGNNACGASDGGACLDRTVAPVAAQVPVVFGEVGETMDDSECSSRNSQVVLPWAEAHGISWLAWTWDTWGSCSSLVSDPDGTVNTTSPAAAQYPTYVKNRLAALDTAAPLASAAATTAMAVISRGAPAFTNDSCLGSSPARYADDASSTTRWRSCTAAARDLTPRWIAYDLAAAPAALRRQVLLTWVNDPMTSEYDHQVVGGPGYNNVGAYTVEINPAAGGSSPPATGWVRVAAVSGNTRHSGEHLFDLAGDNWVRMSATASDGSSGNTDIALDLDVQSVGTGSPDSWMFFGDSITQDGMPHDRRASATGSTVGSFADLVAARTGGRAPAFQDGGIGGLTSAQGAALVPGWLSSFPGRYVGLAYGTNDALQATPGDPHLAQAFHDNLVTMVKAVLATGKVPVLPTIPWGANAHLRANVPVLNQQLAQVRAQFPGALAGPDLYALFQAQPSLIGSDGIHPTWGAGYAAYRTRWASWAAADVYG